MMMQNNFSNLFLFSFLILFSSITYGQQTNYSKVKKYNEFKQVAYEQPSLTHETFFSRQSNSMGLSDMDEMRLDQTVNGHTNYKHYRYKQNYNGLPVFGATYILHEKDGYVVSSNGYYLPNIDLDVMPTISEFVAIRAAKEVFLSPNKEDDIADQYLHINDDRGELAQLSTGTNRLVIVDLYFPSHSNEYRLAYQIDVSAGPANKMRYLIDAHSTTLIHQFPLIMHNTVPAMAKTRYYGDQKIIVDSLEPKVFVLHDPTRGNDGITTYRSMDARDTDFDKFEDDDNIWNFDLDDRNIVALDAHFCTEQFYDFLLHDLDWWGIDNQGRSMNPVVYDEEYTNFVNAFWNGENAYFGNGNCLYGPLTILDVVGHEFMHAVTQSTSNLAYSNESGAINESMSDIMGKALEFAVDSINFSWYLGKKFILNNKAEPFRYMADPTELGDPGFYRGENWIDQADVHRNSGVGNHWFYYLVEGGKGTNENGDPFDVHGLGMERASKIAFVTNTAYLTESSDYNNFYRNSVWAAEELFGTGSEEVISVKEAWKSVGLPYGTLIGDLDLSLSVVSNFFEWTCLDNEYYPLEFIVTNTSTIDYTPQMGAYVDILLISPGSKEFKYKINDPILVGESISIRLDDSLLIDRTFPYIIIYNLMFTDYNANNNGGQEIVINSILNIPDLRLLAWSEPNECTSSSTPIINMIVENLGCETSEQPDMDILIKDESGVIIWKEESIPWSGSIPTNFNMPLDREFTPVPGVYTYFVEIQLNSESDFDLSNNTSAVVIASNEIIRAEFLNPLDEKKDLGGRTRVFDVLNSDFRSFNSLYEYQGQTYFAITGSVASLRRPLCTRGPAELFKNASASSWIEFCVDLTDMVLPEFSFDLVQFQNQNHQDFDDIVNWLTMVEVTWSGTDNGQTYILSQPEGVLQHFKYDLPEGLQGTIRLNFFNASGVTPDQADFLEYDVCLIDNLSIQSGEPVSSTVNLKPGYGLMIYPNPSHDIFNLDYEKEPQQLIIINSQGQEIYKAKGAPKQINLQSLPDGCYSLVASHDLHNPTVKKLVKLSN